MSHMSHVTAAAGHQVQGCKADNDDGQSGVGRKATTSSVPILLPMSSTVVQTERLRYGSTGTASQGSAASMPQHCTPCAARALRLGALLADRSW
jgi:hypothetical protein